jgi:hypothetical protein
VFWASPAFTAAGLEPDIKLPNPHPNPLVLPPEMPSEDFKKLKASDSSKLLENQSDIGSGEYSS